MVMEAPPSPQCVGREFVRQYYTLLNQAPAHLHRFYNNNSSFVHGGLDSPNRETKPVVGQKQIHQKIQQLNFRDCHAKISQVDSQATLGDGVVVQVTGELSNSGQPMRRFTQTFVLAAQTPKKFYVHNDIFRYQDMLFCDEDNEGDSVRSEPEEELEHEHSPNPDIMHANSGIPQHGYYNNTSSGGVVISPQPPHMVAPPPPSAMVPPQNINIVNGQAHPDEVAPPTPQVMAAPLNTAPVLAQQTPSLQQQQPLPEPEEEEPEEEEPEQQPEEELEEEIHPEAEVIEEKAPEIPEVHPQPPVHHVPEIVSNEPKTYATLVKSGGPISFASAAGGLSMSMPPMKPVEVSPPPPVSQRNESLGGSGRGGPRPSRGSNQVRGVGRQERQNNRPSFNEDSPPSNGGVTCGVGEGMDRRPRPSMGSGAPGIQYTDSQQLFLGNLPHCATEEDLKDLFSKYGPIVDLRIHSKPNNTKGMVGNRVPNYGFIIFEDASIVQRVLESRPIWFPNEGPNGLKLNVEEKKTRPRHSLDSSRDSRDSRDNNNRDPRDSRDNRDNRDSRERNMSDSRSNENQPRSGGSLGGPRGGGGMRGGPGGPRGQRGGFSRGGSGMRGGGQFQQRR